MLYNHTPITEENELRELVKRLKERIFEVKQKYGDYRTYCISNKEIPIPYEFIILLSDNKLQNDYNECIAKKLLMQIAGNGYQTGVYFILYEAVSYSMKYQNNRFLQYQTNGNKLDLHCIIEEPYYSINYLQHGNYVYYECSYKYPNSYSQYRANVKQKYIEDIGEYLKGTSLIHALTKQGERLNKYTWSVYDSKQETKIEAQRNEIVQNLHSEKLPQEVALTYKKEEAEKIKKPVGGINLVRT